jgi:hypothetical protein
MCPVTMLLVIVHLCSKIWSDEKDKLIIHQICVRVHNWLWHNLGESSGVKMRETILFVLKEKRIPLK